MRHFLYRSVFKNQIRLPEIYFDFRSPAPQPALSRTCGRQPHVPPKHHVKLPNILSLSRIVFLFVIAALFQATFTGAATAALVLFIIAALTDWADGYVARRWNLITDFGKLMDALADKVLMVGMFVVLLTKPHLFPHWTIYCVLIIVGREFLITGLRLVAASKGLVIAAERGGKWKTLFQILAVAFLLLAHALVADYGLAHTLASGEAWYQSAYLVCRAVGLVLFIVATVLTFLSGYTYMTKYRHVFNEK